MTRSCTEMEPEKETKEIDPAYKGIQNHLILLRKGFSILYWLLQSMVKAYIFYDGTLISQIFTSDVNELWMRSLVVFILFIFTSYMQHLFRKLHAIEEELQKSREEFVTILTHDLKTPPSSILGYTQLIADPRRGELSPERTQAHLRAYEPDKKITLDFKCPSEMIIKGDRTKVRQIFYNLISNAFRYTPKEGHIHIRATLNGNQAAIEVGDTGKGILESEQEKIFRKFEQVKGERHGTGLGLYIVKNFLSGHGSHIRVESSPGKGTKFFFALSTG